MEIIIGKTAGFCFGVKNAVDKTLEELKKDKDVYCLGELVHNKQVMKDLIEAGAIFIEDVEEAKNKVIIRAHGISKNIYQKAKELNLEIKDFTCPKVLHIHKIAEEYKEKNYFIFLVGKKEHPEIIGTISFCGKNAFIIENINDIKEAIVKFKETGLKKCIIISQTTFSIEEFNKIVNTLKGKIDNLEVKNTICLATKQRQEETLEISKIVDMMIIIGGKHSSNTTKLYEMAKQNCKNVIFIDNKTELDTAKINKNTKIGIMAGASTPQKSINDVVEILKKL